MTLRERLLFWLREPLVQFMLGGLAVFLFSSWRGEPADPESRMITLTETQIHQLAANFSQSWMRPPSQSEIDGLIRDYIKEEIYYREAIRMGLDTDDTIIRRRLRSKMEYMAEAQVESERPDDAVLQAWLDKYPQRYAVAVRYSFDQLYLGATDADNAAERLKQLRAGADWRDKGKAISLPRSIEQADADLISKDFGDEFAASLAALPKEQWSGPVASGYGHHLVRVRSVEASGNPKLAQVRQQVENDWRSATVKAREAKAYKALLDGYTIKIAQP
jgi:peptidyl-prolyl cis-trans isomerase C